MFRKLALGLVAAAALSATAFIPTSASAHGSHGKHGGWGHHHGHWGHHGGWGHRHRGFGFGFAPVIVTGGYVHDGCYQKRRIRTSHGLRWRTVNVCYY